MLPLLLASANKSANPGSITRIGSLPKTLSNFGCDVGGGYIHIHGGSVGNTTYNQTYYYYNLSTHTWTTGANSAATINWNILGYHSGTVYSEDGYSNGTYRTGYQYTANSTAAPSTYTSGYLGTTRFEMRMAKVNGTGDLYFMGGYAGSATVADVDHYNWSSWSKAAAMPMGLNGHVSGSYNGNIIVGVGYNSASNRDRAEVYSYNPSTNTWTQIATAPYTTSWGGGCVYKNLLVIGYAASYTDTHKLMVYNLDTGVWKVKNTGLSCRFSNETVPDTTNNGVWILGGMVGSGPGAANQETVARYNDMYFVNEAYLTY